MHSIHERRTVLAMVARTGAGAAVVSQHLSDLFKWRGAIVALNVSVAGTGTLTVAVRGYDAFGAPYVVFQGAALTTPSGVIVYVIYPGSAVPGGTSTAIPANGVASIPIPQEIDVTVTPSDTSTYTYGVTVELLP